MSDAYSKNKMKHTPILRKHVSPGRIYLAAQYLCRITGTTTVAELNI